MERIKRSEQEPTLDEEVLICITMARGYDIQVAMRSPHGLYRIGDFRRCSEEYVTHWIPLPEPPAEREEGDLDN